MRCGKNCRNCEDEENKCTECYKDSENEILWNETCINITKVFWNWIWFFVILIVMIYTVVYSFIFIIKQIN